MIVTRMCAIFIIGLIHVHALGSGKHALKHRKACTETPCSVLCFVGIYNYHMDNKEKLNKPENNEEFIIPEFEDYQSKKKTDVDEVIKKLNERITALEAEENTFEKIRTILEKHNLKYLCDPDLNAVEILFDGRPFRVQIILNKYRLELKLIFPFAAQRASLAMIALFMINFNKDKAFACMHLNPDNGETSMKYSYFISKTAGLDEDDFWVYMTSIIMPAIEKEYVILHCMSNASACKLHGRFQYFLK